MHTYKCLNIVSTEEREENTKEDPSFQKQKKGDEMLSCIDLIKKRKELWEKNKDTEIDMQFTYSVAVKIVEDSKQGELLRQEIKEHAEYLVEMCFSIVNKKLETVPFFLNEVQIKLINKINSAIDDYKQGKRHHLKFLVLKGRQQG